jgi:hypothetical protein
MKSLMLSMGSPKNLSPPWVLDLQQPALDGAHAGRADVAVLGGELLGVVAHVLQHGAQVFQVQQQQAVVVGDLEHQVQHAGLGLVQVEHAPSSSGPMSETVARTGWPCSPNTSHSVVGQAWGVGSIQPALLEHGGQLGPMLPAG